jgi:CheY-like chemotaxis protein
VNYDYIHLVLAKAGFTVRHARNGLEAVEFCLAQGDIDLILMDIKMPEMDGLTATTKIRGFNALMPIVALTAYALPGDSEKAIASGCNDYLAKPIKKEELLLVIRKYV